MVETNHLSRPLKGAIILTDIGVYQVQALPEDLSWDLTPDIDGPYAASGTLDLTLFTAAQHFPGGYLKSGCILGKVTGSTKLGPYLAGASDGRQTAYGVLKASVQVIQPTTGQTKANVGCAVYRAWAVVSLARLPYTSANAAAGGFADTAAQTALSHIHFEA